MKRPSRRRIHFNRRMMVTEEDKFKQTRNRRKLAEKIAKIKRDQTSKEVIIEAKAPRRRRNVINQNQSKISVRKRKRRLRIIATTVIITKIFLVTPVMDLNHLLVRVNLFQTPYLTWNWESDFAKLELVQSWFYLSAISKNIATIPANSK